MSPSRPAPPPTDRAPGGVAGLWALAALGVGVAGATGGLGGPFAALTLLPLAAASWTSTVAAGAALSIASAAILALAGAAGALGPEPAGLLAPALGAAALITVVALLGGGVARRRAQVAPVAPPRSDDLERLLAGQPAFLLGLEPSGAVLGAHGVPPPGVDPETLTTAGLPVAARFEDRPAMLAAIRTAVETGAAELAFDTPAEAPVRLRLRRAEDGRLVAALTDASAEREEARRLEAARAEAVAANLAKSRFLADMSHELRTPLNAIIGFSDVMRARLFGELPERYRDYPDSIHESGRHLLDLINDVLDLSKIEAARYELALEPGDAREPVDAAVRLLRAQAEAAGLTLTADLHDEPIPAELDKRALKQMALNLLSNALKFTPAGGTVAVTLTPDSEDLILTVADTGVGVSPEDLPRLGRPYEQAPAGRGSVGTGLGLSLVRALAELHGGSLTLQSAPGQGLTATVRLPVLTVVPADNVIPFTGRA